MMSKVKLIKDMLKGFVSEEEITAYKPKALAAREMLINKLGKGSDFVGWVKWPSEIKEEEIQKIIEVGSYIREKGKYLVVIGIGGSYLGAKAAIEVLGDYFPSDEKLKVIFVGHTISSTYTKEVLEFLEDKDFCVNVISKSGTTTEPAISFRLFKELLDKKYGSKASERIIATTTIGDSVLYKMSVNEKYQIFSIPEDIGGRYSVLTAVGLVPISAAGFDIKALLEGAFDAYADYSKNSYEENEALLYASIRNILYNKGKEIEILANYEPKISYLGEWWKQLFGESEGKDHKGLFPVSVVYSTDLHSLGQYVQDGLRIFFETVIKINKPHKDLTIDYLDGDFDELNYLSGKTMDFVNKKAMEGTAIAHNNGGVPSLILEISEINEYNLGYLFYFFMFSCGISGYLLDVNPFNQEGVEEYKKNMFRLLGKKGY